MKSDWKKFTARIPEWRERYLAERNVQIARLLAAPEKTETERFWEAEEQIREEAKTLHRCLDGLTRSKMPLCLVQMRAVGMLRREDLADFSPELQDLVFRDFA